MKKTAWCLVAALGCAALHADLEKGFKAPPAAAKPHTWFHMMNGNVTKEGLTRDFEELARAGVGGVQMFDAGCAIPAGGLDFNSPEWFEMFRHAASEARRLGLEICIPNCSGWSSSGGPWNPPSNGMKRVTFRQVTATGPAKFEAKLPRETNDHGFYADIGVFAFPTPPAEKATFPGVTTKVEPDGFTMTGAQAFEAAGFSFRLDYGWAWSADAEIALEISEDGTTFRPFETFRFPLARSGSRDTSLRFHAFPKKTTMRALRAKIVQSGVKATLKEAHPERRARLSNLAAKTFAVRQEVACDTAPTTPDQVVAKGTVRDLTANLRADGTLAWDVPAGDWTILRVGYLCNGHCNHPASDHGRGLEVDKLSAEALDYHFEQYVARLCRTLGPLAGNVATGFNNILVDSFEVGSQNWTQKMEAEFQKRRGYSLRPFMPAFAGYILEDVPTTERFLEDFRRVVSDLFAENYAGALTKKCHAYGLKCSIEPYGNCPADNLQYGQHCDIPMGEFWSHAANPYGTGCGNAKFVSSVAHVWGKPYCGTESFTASPGPGSGRWMTTPFSIKAQGDSAYASGVNRIIYHRFTHQPWADDKYLPGMTMGRWGMHLDRTQTWWAFAKPWFAYQTRCQYLLQAGTFCADVLFFAGEAAPNQGGNTDGGSAAAAFFTLPDGYASDICPTDAMYQLKVEDGCVVVPGGVRYRVLALPPMEAVSPEMVVCVTKLRDAGATVVWPKKPVRAPGLKWGRDGDRQVRLLADELWARGIFEGSPVEALNELGVAPDVAVVSNEAKNVDRLRWLHRRNAEADWYFVAMPNRAEASAVLSFRQTGRVPELWDAETGTCAPADVWREEKGRTFVTVPFSVCGSKFVVFRTAAKGPHATACTVAANRRTDPVVADPVQHTLEIRAAQYGVRAEKTRPNCADVAAFVKPGKKVAATNDALGGDPANGQHKALEVVYTLDGATKRDVVKEFAAYTLPARARLVSAWYGVIDPAWKPGEDRLADVTAKLAGLVTNGTLSARATNGLAGCDPAPMTPKRLYVTYVYDGVEKKTVVPENQELALPPSARAPLPLPDSAWRDGALFAWQPLTATLAQADGTVRTLKADPPLPLPVAGAWTVSFPNGFLPNKLAQGPDETVTFDRLASWSENRNPGVRYFSGIATYAKTLDGADLAKLRTAPGTRLVLDLGDVRNFAEVTVNGTTFPVLWKPPFRVDITDAVRPGASADLRIRVANLWANRLIGDDREHADDCTWQGGMKDGVKEIGLKEIPQWVKEGKKSPTGRCTFTTWKHWDKNDELLPSGILGPVYLRALVPAAPPRACGAATRAIDLSDAAQRAAQPTFVQPSFACSVADGEWADGRWCYRFHVTQAWNGSLPQWPSVNLKPAVADWTPYDRFVVDVFNDAIGGDVLCAFIAGPDGRIQNGLCPPALPLADWGYHRWVIDLKTWPKETDPKNIGRVHFFFTTPSSADVHLAGFHLLKPGEPLPAVSEAFLEAKVRPALRRAEVLRKERRRQTLTRFADRCRAAGQTGAHAWIGKATSMEKVRPRDDFDVAAADRFSLKLARGERESLQVLVMPNGRDLAQVTVEARAEGIPASALKTSLVGYVKTVNPPPYKGGVNVATNLPGGYVRTTRSLPTGWWPDPILDWADTADVKGDDLQAFWVRMTCPDGQRAGVYPGTITVKGEGWKETFPLTVRVWDFAVPKKSPLPLAITFSPGPHTQFATAADTALANSLRRDPLAPVNAWRKHEKAWGEFLADYYITMDSLYHGGAADIHWDVLRRLKDEGRLGLFNLGYWTYPADMAPQTLENWKRSVHARFDAPYAKAKALGLLDHAYLYGCDEISPKYFANIAYALAELKRLYPEVPRFTTAYDHDFGTGVSQLGDMDWFTPTTVKYAENFAKVAPSRAAGHQVWWYIACGPHAPYANLFVEYAAIEARQLMGAQTVKWRPDGFLYYQLSIWNARRPISGANPFTDWEPRSWTRYHGDGSWFCCGPDGTPCATIRMENFRDGLEDLAYAQEYERRTGKACEVPVEVCRAIDQFSDDPQVYYAWRDRLAEAVEKAGRR